MTGNMERVLEAFFRKDDNALLVFLFGSCAKGCARPDSDVDVAVLFRNVPDWQVLAEMREDLSERVGSDVDLVALNDAGPVIGMQVLRTGVPVKKDEKPYRNFFVRTLKEYDDLKYVRKNGEDNILRGRIYG